MNSEANEANPTLTNAHFIKPLFNPSHIPKPRLLYPSNPNICNDLKHKIVLKCRKHPNSNWNTWVHNMEQTHQHIWSKVGIFNAIKLSTFSIHIDVALILSLAQKWCPKTNTFVFKWGECSLTLEDVLILGGFSVLGASVVADFGGGNPRDEEEMKAELVKCCVDIRRRSKGGLRVPEWIKYFMGKGGELECVGLVVLWLSKFVFSTGVYWVDSNVFELAIRLVKGTRIALAPAVLASIYRDLSLLKEEIVGKNSGGSKLVLLSQLQLVQVWAWERFPSKSPEPMCLVCGEPRVARWHGVRRLKLERCRFDVEGGEELFVWRPYGLDLLNWEFPKFYRDEEMCMSINSEVDEDLMSFARCLNVCELVGVDCVEQYLPHRVAKQFGMDQDIPSFVPRENADLKIAWRSYDKPIDGLHCYVPPRLQEGDVTARYLRWRSGVCRRKRTHRKLKIVFKRRKSCNEAMQLYSWSCEESSNEKLTPFDSKATQIDTSLATEIGSLNGRNVEDVVHHGGACEQISVDAMERDGCNIIMDDHVGITKVAENVRDGLDSKRQKIICDEEHHSANPLNVLNPLSCTYDKAIMQRDSLDGTPELTGKTTPSESMRPPSPVNLIAENASLEVSIPEIMVEDGRTGVQVSPLLEYDTNIPDIEEVAKVVQSVSKDLEKSSKQTPHFSSTQFNLPVAGNTKELPSENRLKMVNEVGHAAVMSIPSELNFCSEPAIAEQATMTDHEAAKQVNKFGSDALTIVDVEESRQDVIESLCKDLDDRLTILEAEISILMAAT